MTATAMRDPEEHEHQPFEGLGFGGGPRGGSRRIEQQCLDFCPICRTADVVRATMPAEFQEHWRAWQREMLLAFRSLVDHYIEHLERDRRGGGISIEDIPVE
jgi:hypothetical protein